MPALPPGRPGCPNAPGRRRPLPDPAAIRLCLVPDPAPPYDEEDSPGEPPGRARAGAAGPRDTEAPAGAAARREAEAAAVRDRAAAAPPAPPAWQSRFAQVLAETLAGSRPQRQIVPWTTEQARDHIQRLGPQLASAHRPRVRRVVTFRPASDVVEMTVVVGFGPRVRALAVRLERSGDTAAAAAGGQPSAGRWLCTAVEAA